jgi:hypothetical protein
MRIFETEIIPVLQKMT